MSADRSVKRNQQLQAKKQAKEQLKRVEKLVKSSENACKICAAKFDNRNPAHLDGWQVRVYENHIELFCERCQNEN